MTFVEAIQSVFSNYANFNGRARRSEYWYFALFNFVVNTVLGLLAAKFSFFGIIEGLFGLAVLVPCLAVCVRRLHDIGKSGICILFALIPCVGGILLLVWCARDSEPDNQYGPNPKGGSGMNAY